MFNSGDKLLCLKDNETFVKGREYKIINVMNVENESYIIVYQYSKLGNDYGRLFLESKINEFFKKL